MANHLIYCRHYYRAGVILRVSGKRLMYKFGPKTPHWRQRVKTASTGPLLNALPKDFCDNVSMQDNVPKQTEAISRNVLAITNQSLDVVGISQSAAAVKMELGQASPGRVTQLKEVTAVTEVIPSCDENNNNTTNPVGDNRGDVYTDSVMTSMRFYNPKLIQAGQEPPQQVPGGNCAMPLPSFQELESSASIHGDTTHSQHSCHIADNIGFQQSPSESSCLLGTEPNTVDLEVTLLNELESQTGLYAGYTGVDSSGPVKMVDIGNDMGASHVCGSSYLFCQTYQQRQLQGQQGQQAEQESLHVDNYTVESFDRLSPDAQPALLSPMAEVQQHVSASLLMLTA